MAQGETERAGRRRDLDGLRGVAILLIIILHYVSRGGYFHYLGPKPLALLLDSFWSGVDIFFVLSGFLIGGIILDNGRADNFFRVFYLRRSLRILPVAFLTIGLSYLVIPILTPSILWHTQVPSYAYLLFINNFWTARGLNPFPPLEPMWSLAIEEQFYWMAPAFMLMVGARIRNVLLLMIVMISPILRLRDFGVSSWDFTLFRLDGFAAGILVAALLRSVRFEEVVAQSRKTINRAIIGLLIGTLVFTITPGYSLRVRVAIGISLYSIATAGVILFLHLNRNGALSYALSRSWLAAIGRVSYFLYLMHLPILVCVVIAGVPWLMQPLLALGICMLFAWVSWQLLESRLINIGKRLPYKGAAGAVSSEAALATGGAGNR